MFRSIASQTIAFFLFIATGLAFSGLLLCVAFKLAESKGLSGYSMIHEEWVLFAMLAIHPFLATSYYRVYLKSRMRREVWFFMLLTFQMTAVAAVWRIFCDTPEFDKRLFRISSFDEAKLGVAVGLLFYGITLPQIFHLCSRIVFRKYWKSEFEKTGRLPFTLKTALSLTTLIAVCAAMIVRDSILPRYIRISFAEQRDFFPVAIASVVFLVPLFFFWRLIQNWQSSTNGHWYSALTILTLAPLLSLVEFVLTPPDPHNQILVLGLAVSIWTFVFLAIIWQRVTRAQNSATHEADKENRRGLFSRFYRFVCWTGKNLAYAATALVWAFLTCWLAVHWFHSSEETGTTAIHRSLIEELGGNVDSDTDWIDGLNRKHGAGTAPQDNAVACLVELFPEAVMAELEQTENPEALLEQYLDGIGFDSQQKIAVKKEKEPYYKQLTVLVIESLSDRVNSEKDSFSYDEEKLISLAMQSISEETERYGSAYFDHMVDSLSAIPWSDEEFPKVAAWLDQIVPELDRLRNASRQAYFSPFVRMNEQGRKRLPSQHPMNPGANLTVYGSSLLQISAYRNLGNGNIEAAIDDIEATKNFCREEVLIQTFDCYRETYRGQWVIEAAFKLIHSAIQQDETTQEQANQLIALLDEFPSPRELLASDWMNFPLWIRKDVVRKALSGQIDNFRMNEFEFMPTFMLYTKIPWLVDWQAANDSLNDEHEKLKQWFESEAGDLYPEKDFYKIGTAGWFSPELEMTFCFLSGNKRKGWWFGTHYHRIDPYGNHYNWLGPLRSIVSLMVERRLVKLAIAMELYRKSKGDYPQQLSELVPKFLPEIPADPYMEDEELIFNAKGPSGPVVYSVGRDQKDNLNVLGGDEIDFVLDPRQVLETNRTEIIERIERVNRMRQLR